MEKIIYAKCSTERKPAYQIVTVIGEENGKRSVRKTAVCPDARAHIRHIYETFLSGTKAVDTERVHLAACRMIDENSVEFEYIEGKRLDCILRQHIEEKNLTCIAEDIGLLRKLIYDVREIEGFSASDAFTAVFGSGDDLCGEPAARGMNIDMAMSNIILNEHINIIDYEWTFDFLVPLKFILYRSLFLDGDVNAADPEIKNLILNTAEITEEEQVRFLEMEKVFQNHISGIALNDLYRAMPIRNYTVSEANLLNTINEASVTDSDGRLLFQKEYCSNTFEYNLDSRNIESASIIVSPMQFNGIIKVISCKGMCHGEEITVPIKSNAVLEIIDDYYFSEQPQFYFELQEIDSLALSVKILVKDNSLVLPYANALKAENEGNLRFIALEEQNNQLKEQNAELDKTVQEFSERYRHLERIRKKLRS